MPRRRIRTLAQTALLPLALLLTAAGTPAGTVIENTAIYEDELDTIPSETVRTTVQAVCAAELTPRTHARDLRPGEQVTVPYTLTNHGNATFTFPLTLDRSSVNATVTADLNGNKLPDDAAVTRVTLEPDAQVTLLVTASVDHTGPATATLLTGCDGTLAGTLSLNGYIGAPRVTKTVIGSPTAEAGDTVQYAITVTNPETVPMEDVIVEDVLHPGLEFTGVTPDAGQKAELLADGRTRVFWTVTLAPGETRSYTLSTRVRTATSDDTEITNTATATGEGGRSESTPPAVIRVFTSRILIGKAVSATVADAGQNVTYTLTVTNPSTTTIREVTVTDTSDPRLTIDLGSVKVGTQHVTATRDAAKPNVLVIPVGTLASQASATITYVARLPLDSGGEPIVNQAQAKALGMQGTVIATITSNLAAVNVTLRQKLAASGNDLVGRVYVDRNSNLRFDEGTDTPVQGARLLLAGGREALSDASGLYSFANVPGGTLAVRLDGRSVPYQPADDRHLGDMWTPNTGVITAHALAVLDFPLKPNALTWTVTLPGSAVTFTTMSGGLTVRATNRTAAPVCLLLGERALRLEAHQTLTATHPALTPPLTREVSCK